MSLIETIKQVLSQSLQQGSKGIIYAEDGAAEMLHISAGLSLLAGKRLNQNSVPCHYFTFPRNHLHHMAQGWTASTVLAKTLQCTVWEAQRRRHLSMPTCRCCAQDLMCRSFSGCRMQRRPMQTHSNALGNRSQLVSLYFQRNC